MSRVRHERILRAVDGSSEDLVDLVRSLIRAHSENPPGNQRAIMAIVKEHLKAQGIPFEAISLQPDRENIIARVGPAQGARSLALYGHTDVVPAGDPKRWSFPPFAGDVKEGWIQGRGAADMKAGTGAALFVAALLHRLDVPLGGPLLFHANPDEEDFVTEEKLLYRLIDDGRLRCTACIMGEPSGLGEIGIGDKGDLWLRIRCRGRAAHGSSPMLGDSAVEACLRALRRLKRAVGGQVRLPAQIQPVVADSRAAAGARARMLGQPRQAAAASRALDRVTINVGRIQGGTMINVVPDECEADVALCIPAGVSPAILAEQIKVELAAMAEVEVLAITEPNFTRPDDPVVSSVQRASREVLGTTAKPIHDIATSDAHAFRLRGIPTLLYGPGDSGLAHAVDERVSVKETVATAKIFALAALDYLGQGK